jgi:glycosyltransferase involved in cell wall biosynthesis
MDLSQLNITFIAGTLGQGGAERQLYYILKTLRQQGAQLSVLCLTQGEFWEEPIRQLGVPVVWVGKSASRLVRLVLITRWICQHRPRVVQSQHFYTNLYAFFSTQFCGKYGIGTMRSDCISEVHGNGRWMGPLSLKLPRIMAANSKLAIRNAITMGVPANRLFFFPNVVDCEYFSPLLSKPHTDAVKLIFVGTLVPNKHAEYVLNALSWLGKEYHVSVNGLIVGDGPQRSELEYLAALLGLSKERVLFMGRLLETVQAYNDSDILVLPSDWEGTPNVILEAMACGLPVVSTRVGGVPDIVMDGKTGFLVEPGDQAGLNAAVLKLVENAALRKEMGDNARRFVLEHHNLDRLPAILNTFYGTIKINTDGH